MRIETERLLITDFTLDMAETVHLNSLDEDTRRFVPDEVFETIDEARETIGFLIGQYASEDGPFVHPILLKTGENIGYVQLVKFESGWEIGYHVAKQYKVNTSVRDTRPKSRPGTGSKQATLDYRATPSGCFAMPFSPH